MPAAKKTPLAVAKEAEAKETGPVTIEHKGLEFEIPVGDDIPLELVEAESDVEAIRAVVGEDQWATYRATRPTLGDFKEFADKVLEASGMGDSGN